MLRVLCEKIFRLGRDEDGAALVVTLAVFFFMYLGCMGVYAVSMAVKERIHLQNAADAAAYSAAVVQADTLSRIATINRAMSWTYVQMTRHQMDYAVYQWLKHTCKHYDDDKRKAKEWATQGMSLCGNSKHKKDYHISRIYLNGHDNFISSFSKYGLYLPTRASIGTAVKSYAALHPLFLLKFSIRQDKRIISQMNSKIVSLLKDMPEKIEDTVQSVLGANLAHLGGTGAYFFLRQSKNPKTDYMRMLSNNVDDEERFLSFSGYGTVKGTFENGIDDWFVRGEEAVNEGGDGIQRSYNHAHEGKLVSQWDWHATKWICFWVPYKWIHIPIPKLICSHPSHEKDTCRIALAGHADIITQSSYAWEEKTWENGTPPSDMKKWPYDSLEPEDESNTQKYSDYYREEITKDADGNETTHYYVLKEREESYTVFVPDAEAALDLAKSQVKIEATCYGDNDTIYTPGTKKYYVGAKAEPYILTKEYFGTDGTISVGVRRRNENVFARVLGAVDGIFTAFDPDWNGVGAATHTYVFASAKAGYKNKGESAKSLEYKVGWQDGSWNLCQSDLDAVFIPVRRAFSRAKGAEGGIWEGDGDSRLSIWVSNVAEWKPVDGAGEGDKGETDKVNISAPRGILRGEKEDGKLDWEKLSRVMFH